MPIPYLSRFAALPLACAALLFYGAVHGHGLPQKVHGGLVATELDLGFEAYLQDRRLVVSVTDHDSPFDTKLFQAEARAGKTVIALESAPGGKLVSKPLAKSPDLRGLELTLSAAVLPAPIRLSFGP